MPRQLVYFDKEVLDKLKDYTKKKYGKRRALSIVVQLAVEKYLEEEDIKSGKKKSATKTKTF